jgi:dihydroorotate dehydrogenase (NAD+) catalytic subunit
MGGVTAVQDVLDYLACGASAVAVGAGLFRDHLLAARLARELQEELDGRGIGMQELVGAAHLPHA